MNKVDVLVIGGSATGLVAAMTAKSDHPEKSVMVIRKEEKVMIPCGIPYIYGTTGNSNNNILPDGGLNKLGVDIVVDEVISVDGEKKVCATKSGKTYEYEKLIIGTGSLPAVPGWLEGTGLENVFTIPKDKDYLDRLQEKFEGINKVVVVGAGFIGVEVSDELNKGGKDVSLVEILPTILGATFDEEFALQAEENLSGRGVHVLSNTGIKSINGEGKVESVTFNDGTTLATDAVILS